MLVPGISENCQKNVSENYQKTKNSVATIHPRFAAAASAFSAMRLATTALTKVSPVPVQDTPTESASA